VNFGIARRTEFSTVSTKSGQIDAARKCGIILSVTGIFCSYAEGDKRGHSGVIRGLPLVWLIAPGSMK
jgi:hypothetical protein